MALYIDNKRVNAIYKTVKDELGNIKVLTISAVYKGSKLVWQYISSCFGRGYWINDKPWSDTDAWKN